MGYMPDWLISLIGSSALVPRPLVVSVCRCLKPNGKQIMSVKEFLLLHWMNSLSVHHRSAL